MMVACKTVKSLHSHPLYSREGTAGPKFHGCGTHLQKTVSCGNPPAAVMGMVMYEYKTVILQLEGMGWLSSKEIPALEATLNAKAKQGWRLRDTILPPGTTGECDKIIIILERETGDRF
jgi:hypothetical protein